MILLPRFGVDSRLVTHRIHTFVVFVINSCCGNLKIGKEMAEPFRVPAISVASFQALLPPPSSATVESTTPVE